VVGDLLRGLQRAVVLEIGGDAGGAEGVIADAGLDAGGLGAPLYHAVGVLLPHGVAGQCAGLAGRRAEQGAVRVAGDAPRHAARTAGSPLDRHRRAFAAPGRSPTLAAISEWSPLIAAVRWFPPPITTRQLGGVTTFTTGC
jgi:hypothetical protein